MYSTPLKLCYSITTPIKFPSGYRQLMMIAMMMLLLLPSLLMMLYSQWVVIRWYPKRGIICERKLVLKFSVKRQITLCNESSQEFVHFFHSLISNAGGYHHQDDNDDDSNDESPVLMKAQSLWCNGCRLDSVWVLTLTMNWFFVCVLILSNQFISLFASSCSVE